MLRNGLLVRYGSRGSAKAHFRLAAGRQVMGSSSEQLTECEQDADYNQRNPDDSKPHHQFAVRETGQAGTFESVP